MSTNLVATVCWRPDDVLRIGPGSDWALPVVDQRPPTVVMGHDVWDMWQVAYADGRTAVFAEASWWFALVAPKFPDPEQRHDVARIRLLSHRSHGWRDHGDVFPDGFTPGSREWSGSAVLGDDDRTLTMYFTAAGRRNGPRSFEQRLFAATGMFDPARERCDGWSRPRQVVAADGDTYAVADEVEAPASGIRGFRDPGFFRDPVDGRDYILFTGSAPGGAGRLGGLIGAATRDGDKWRLLPPVVDAVGVNSELERPHIVVRDGLYYLFWSTHARRFAPALGAPTGLYAMVADALAGTWRPVNGSGLVAGNPPAAPFQAYSWWVTAEGEVTSFIDYSGVTDPHVAGAAERKIRFGGMPAAFFRLRFAGDRVGLAT